MWKSAVSIYELYNNCILTKFSNKNLQWHWILLNCSHGQLRHESFLSCWCTDKSAHTPFGRVSAWWKQCKDSCWMNSLGWSLAQGGWCFPMWLHGSTPRKTVLFRSASKPPYENSAGDLQTPKTPGLVSSTPSLGEQPQVLFWVNEQVLYQIGVFSWR